jgi:hypothetical protein
VTSGCLGPRCHGSGPTARVDVGSVRDHRQYCLSIGRRCSYRNRRRRRHTFDVNVAGVDESGFNRSLVSNGSLGPVFVSAARGPGGPMHAILLDDAVMRAVRQHGQMCHVCCDQNKQDQAGDLTDRARAQSRHAEG